MGIRTRLTVYMVSSAVVGSLGCAAALLYASFYQDKLPQAWCIWIAATLAAVLTATAAAARAGGGLSGSLAALTARLKALAEGDLHTDTPPAGFCRETVQLATSLQTAILSLGSVIRELDGALAQLSMGSLEPSVSCGCRGDLAQLPTSLTAISGTLGSIFGRLERTAVELDGISIKLEQQHSAAQRNHTAISAAISKLTGSATTQMTKAAQSAQEITEMAGRAGDAAAACVQTLKQLRNTIAQLGSLAGLAAAARETRQLAAQLDAVSKSAGAEAIRMPTAGSGLGVIAHELHNISSHCAESAKQTARLATEAALNVAELSRHIDTAYKELNPALIYCRSTSTLAGQLVRSVSAQPLPSANRVPLLLGDATVLPSLCEELDGQAQLLRLLAEKYRQPNR